MKCNRCGREIDELEIFCDECKKELKSISSRTDVKELEELIENQKRFEDLDNTKELVDLDKLVEEELEKEENIEEKETEKTEIVEIEETTNDEIIENETQPNKKKLIIIISVISAILIIGMILLFVFLGKDRDNEEQEVKINYEKAIKDYGNNITNIVKEYIAANEEIPTWQYVIENLDYDRYEVQCDNHNIYSDGSVYLSSCKVNNKKTKYTYGIELEEVKEGKKISIYKQNYNNEVVYSSETYNTSQLVSTITCQTENCEYISAYDKYVLIKEDNNYYLYDYDNDSINFGPFILNNEYDILVYNNELYGILYTEENKNNIYNVKTGKVLENIKGYLLPGQMGFDPAIIYKYNYAVLVNNNKNEFINLKTGNISYTIKEDIISFTENTTKKIIYITTINSNNKYKIYSSTGKELFDGKEYSEFIIGNNNFLVSTETNFKVYDNNLKLKTQSNNYDKILGLYNDFVVAVKDSNLMILSIEDEILTTFEDAWDGNYIFHNNLSGKNNDKITLVVENKKIPYGTQGNCIEYYYTISTKTSSFTEKIGTY